MAKLASMVRKIRSKNAGPFWLTIDIFCEDAASFAHICAYLEMAGVAALFKIDERAIRRFDMPQLNVIKISLPRPQIQGTATDTDMHGASFAVLLEEMDIGASHDFSQQKNRHPEG